MKYFNFLNLSAKVVKNERGYYEITFAKKVEYNDKTFFTQKFSINDISLLLVLLQKIAESFIEVVEKRDEVKLENERQEKMKTEEVKTTEARKKFKEESKAAAIIKDEFDF